MSYIITVANTDYASGWVTRGQWVQLGNYRIWMSASGNANPQISAVSGGANIWFAARQQFYNGNLGAYVFYVSPITTSPKSFNNGESYGAIGDTAEMWGTDGVEAHRFTFNVADSYQGTHLSIEKMSTNKVAGSLGPEKTSGFVANGVDLTVGNLKFRVGSTNMLQVSHVSSAVRLVGQATVNFANAQQTHQTNLLTTTTPVYMGNPGWYVFSSNGVQLSTTVIAEFMDSTNNVKYKVTQVLFTSDGGATLNRHFICVERY